MTNKLSADAALRFMLAGKAFVTLRSGKTGARYTYRIRKAPRQPNDVAVSRKGQDVWFVSLLVGPENSTSYSYMGVIQNNAFRLTQKSHLPITSVPVKAFRYVFERLVKGIEPKDVEIWHEGRCGRCGHLLTVPESIESGYGPECIQLVGVLNVDFNKEWTELKQSSALRKDAQERQAFMEGI